MDALMKHAEAERALEEHRDRVNAIDPDAPCPDSCPTLRARNAAYLAFTKKPHVSVR